MNCEQAEEHLSAYLDEMLEPSARAELAAHLSACDTCRAELAELRRLDGVLAATPRIAPPDSLHDRIFESPEFARLLRGLERSAPEHEAPVGVPAAGSRRHAAPPGWAGGTWRVAAVLALVLGSALLIKQGLLHSGTSSGQGSTLTIGDSSRPAPLGAGSRAVYQRDGVLWSAPATGAGIAQRLTPTSVSVSGWAVSPDGSLVAYIDGRAGRVHIIRSDDQNDRTLSARVGDATNASFWSSAAGRAVSAGLAWSPDGTRIAYLAADATGNTTLHLMNADGSNDRALNGDAAALTGKPVWSANSLRIAYTQSNGSTQSVWSYSTDTESAAELASQADPDTAGATVGQLAWLTDALHPTITWSAQDSADTITGLFSQSLLSSGTPQRLTPAVMRFGAADFSAVHSSGAWLVSGVATTPAVATVSAQTGAMTVAATFAEVSHGAWSPDGSAAYILTQDGRLEIWTPGSAPVTALSGVTGTPVWSSDGRQLAAQANGQVVGVHVVAGAPASVVQLGTAGASAHLALLWSPDGLELAISGSSGVSVVSADGKQSKQVDTHPATGGLLVWTVAG
jgi:Tol biopolymer transport system component